MAAAAVSTRIARVAQQLRSISELHTRELEQVAQQLEATGAGELAERLRVFRQLHADEISVAIDELEDLSGPATATLPMPEQSPKRARWLEEQEEAPPQPLTRRELLNLGGESEPE